MSGKPLGLCTIVISLVLMVSRAYAVDPMLAQVQEIMQSMGTLKNDIKKAEDEKVVLAAEEKRLIQTNELLKSAEKNFQNDVDGYVREKRDHDQQRDAHNAEGESHGKKVGKNETGGWNYSFPSMSKEWRDAYSGRYQRLRAWGERLEDRNKTLVEREKGLKERRDDLSKASLEWGQKKKENNSRLNESYAKYTQLINHVSNLNNLPFSRQLIQKAGASEECSNIPGVEKLEMYTSTGQVQLEGAAEKAHRCLQRIWDGAR